MGRPTLVLDALNRPVPVLGFAGVLALTAGAVSVNGAIPSGAYIVRVAAVNDCYIAFGNSGVVASGASSLFPKGSELLKVPAGATHIAVIQHTTGGAVTVTDMD